MCKRHGHYGSFSGLDPVRGDPADNYGLAIDSRTSKYLAERPGLFVQRDTPGDNGSVPFSVETPCTSSELVAADTLRITTRARAAHYQASHVR